LGLPAQENEVLFAQFYILPPWGNVAAYIPLYAFPLNFILKILFPRSPRSSRSVFSNKILILPTLHL